MSLEGKKALLTTCHRRIGSGGSMQMFLLAASLVRAGAKVHCVFASAPGESPASRHLDRLSDLGVTLHDFHPDRWFDPFELVRMRRLLAGERFDIVHTHKGGDLSLVLLASLGLRIPVLVTTRGVNFPLGLNHLKYNARRLDRVIVVSEDIRRVLVASGVRAEKIRVVYGGVDTDRFRPRAYAGRAEIRTSLGIPEGVAVGLVAANLVRQKGHEDYLRAAAKLAERHPDAVHLFAGKGDDRSLVALASELRLGSRARFLGFRRDIEDVFAAADYSVVASTGGEGVSGVLRESMACAVPVITTHVGGNTELVRDGETGLVVPIGRPDALAQAMARLIEDPALRRRLAEAGRDDVLANHSAESRARRIFAVYEEILAEKSARVSY